MRQRAHWAVVCAFASLVLGSAGAGTARAATVTVCPSGCAFSEIAPAIAAAGSGDTIRVAAGTYSGGFTIDKDLSVLGAGAGATSVEGGGPVITIGVAGAASEPTVSISRLTITGGVSKSSAECGPSCGTNYVTATALGGGIEVPPGAASVGATVTVTDSVITGNRAAPTGNVPSVRAICPGEVHCVFGLAGGGGIDNWGTMTLVKSTVSENEVSGSISDADGGGILNMAGTLTLLNSEVVDNRALASPPFGRFAEGGGIFAANGSVLIVRDSAVNGNVASLASSIPHPYPLQGGGTDQSNAHAGGIHLGDSGSATIENSRIDGNQVAVDNPVGEPIGFDAAVCICGDSPLVLRNSSVSDNRVTATVSDMTDSGPAGNALEYDGSAEISNTRITGNSSNMTTTNPGSTASVLGAVIGFNEEPALISNSIIRDNSITATSANGTAIAQGAAIVNDGVLELRNDEITQNTATASGLAGSAQGGAIWNGMIFPDTPTPQLTLQNTIVMHNTLSGSPGFTLQGGGIYTLGFPITLINGVIAHNVPDQCFGC
jgi:hypothetical protein